MSDTTKGFAFPKRMGLSKKAKHAREHSLRKLLRDEIWIRDEGKSRASGKTLFRDSDIMHLKGECCHIQSKGSEPSRRLDPNNCLLMSGEEHVLSDGRGGYRLKLFDAETGEKAMDATRKIRFVLHRKDGSIASEYVS